MTAFADSTRLAVLKHVQTTLQGMRISGGYHYDVKSTSVSLDPIVLETVPPTDLPFFVVQEGPPGQRQFRPAMQVYDIWSAVIIARVQADGYGADRKVPVFEALVADLEKALTVDITRGGLAIDTRLRQPDEPLFGLGAQGMVIVVQPVEFRTVRTYGQP